MNQLPAALPRLLPRLARSALSKLPRHQFPGIGLGLYANALLFYASHYQRVTATRFLSVCHSYALDLLTVFHKVGQGRAMLEVYESITLGYAIVWAIVCVFVGILIGLRKKQVVSGAVWSLLLGPIGWIIVLALPNRGRKCPFCGGALASEDAVKCVHCGSDIPPVEKPKKPAQLPPPGKARRR